MTGRLHACWIACLFGAMLLTGCTKHSVTVYEHGDRDADLIATGYRATDALLANAREQMNRDQKILVATFVSLSDVEETSKLGRVFGEIAATRLAQRQYAVVNLKLRSNSVAIRSQNGEFLLSRNMADVGKQHNAKAALVGTYTVSRDKIYVNMKLTNVQDSTVIGAVDFEIPKGPRAENLLTNMQQASNGNGNGSNRAHYSFSY